MTELSPAAQSINEIIGDLYDLPVRCVVAAALRAVADQVTPEAVEPKYTPSGDPNLDAACVAVWMIWYANNSVHTKLLAIAAELEGQALPQAPTQPTTDP